MGFLSSFFGATPVRWALFIAVFFTLIFCSFWGYVWIHRVEFTQVTFNRACPPLKISLGTISIQDLHTVVITGIVVRDDADEHVFSAAKAELSAPTLSWLTWLLIPSTSPLHLRSLTITTSDDSLPFTLPMTIDSFVIQKPS